MKRYKVYWLEHNGNVMTAPSQRTVTVETEQDRDSLLAFLNGRDGVLMTGSEEME